MKSRDKLNKILCGIREMYKLPDALYIVDPSKEEIAIREARKLHIPVFGIVDTNCDPDMVDYVIPGNDDAIRAVKLITGVMANAICEAQGEKLVDYVKDEDKNSNANEIMQRAVDSVKKKEDRPRRFDNNKRFEDRRNFNNERKNDRKEVAQTKEVKKEVKEEKVAVKEEKASTDLSTLTVAELREMAKSKEVKGYSTMKKSELIDALK